MNSCVGVYNQVHIYTVYIMLLHDFLQNKTSVIFYIAGDKTSGGITTILDSRNQLEDDFEGAIISKSTN